MKRFAEKFQEHSNSAKVVVEHVSLGSMTRVGLELRKFKHNRLYCASCERWVRRYESHSLEREVSVEL